MRVLWFSSSPANASVEFGHNHPGVGWIAALETIVSAANEHELAICFIYNGTSFKKLVKNNVTYYGIPEITYNGINRILNRHLAKIHDEFDSPLYDEVINDFKPDIIHVFGTENGYGKVLVNKFDKVIFHLQGLVAPYYEVFFPPGVSKLKAMYSDSIGNMVRGLTFYNYYNLFNVRVKREVKMIRHWKYFSGRTSWDKNYVQLLNPNAVYYHCEELLRINFFQAEWQPGPTAPAKRKINIGSTMNPNIYKGLDLVYNVLPLLEHFDITWNIYGIGENNNMNRVVKKSLNIKHHPSMVFHGPLPAAKLAEQLMLCDFFVHPSYIDNSPNSVCEAMLLGMPVLASAVGGIKSLITNDHDGFLFNPHDRYDLAGLLANLINHYDAAVTAGAHARVTALKRHNSEDILKSINQMYHAVKNDTTGTSAA